MSEKEKRKYTPADAREALRAAVGLDRPKNGNDYNADGAVSVSDARSILREAVGLDGQEPPTQAEQVGSSSAADIAAQMGSFVPASGNDMTKAAYGAYADYKNMPSFSYDYRTDPLYTQLKADYEKTAKKGSEHLAAQAQAHTGGYGNSYAQTLANQFYHDTMNDFNDVVVDLEQRAYDRYTDERQKKLQEYSMLSDLSDTVYGRELTAAQLAAQYGNYKVMGDLLGVDLSRYADTEQAKQALDWGLQTGDFSRLQALGYDTSYLAQSYELNLKGAQLDYGAGVLDATGDASVLENYGYSTEELQKAKALDLALTAAANGDFSKLRDVGIDPTYLEESALREAAAYYAQYGDLRKLRSLGVDTSYLSAMNAAALAQQQASAYG